MQTIINVRRTYLDLGIVFLRRDVIKFRMKSQRTGVQLPPYKDACRALLLRMILRDVERG